MRLVLVEWEDSLGVGVNWQPLSDIVLEPLICRSVGWLAAEGDRTVLIVPHTHDADERRDVVQSGCGDMLIPKCAIVRMTDLIERAGLEEKPSGSPPGLRAIRGWM